MTHGEFDKFIAKGLSIINAKIFEYLTRTTLTGISYQISIATSSTFLKFASATFAILLGLQLLFELNTLFDWLAGKLDFGYRLFAKIIISICFIGMILAAYFFVFAVIDAFNAYYMGNHIND